MPPEKAAKKSAKKHEVKRHDSKDLRRAYEHLGRVEILQRTLGSSGEDVASLVSFAQGEIANGTPKATADLLRAAEHLSFAEIFNQIGAAKAQVFGGLMAAIRDEFERLQEKAEEHWEAQDADPTIARIYKDSLKKAGQASDAGSYRQALELVRGAEALAHVKLAKKKHAPKRVAARSNARELAAS